MTGRAPSVSTRRRFLKGTGAALAAPFMLAHERRALAAPPERLITIYFGNGMPPALTKQGLTGVLAPFAKYGAHTSIVRGIKATASSPGITEHSDGSASFCCGASTTDGNRKGGPSLDWVAQSFFAPKTPHKVKAAGVFSAGQAQKIRWYHSWREGGQPNPATTDPLALFVDLFEGGSALPAISAADDKYKRAVLSAVRKEYERLADDRTRLPLGVREQLAQHRILLTEIEDRLTMPTAGTTCAKPPKPAAAKTEGIMEPGAYAAWNRAWPVIAKVFAAGMRCDLFRFGSLTMTGGGDEWQATYNGKTVGDAHGDWFHHYDSNKAAVDAIITWEMSQIALFLEELASTKEADGRSMLETTTVVIGTELGMPQGHHLHDLTFFIVGGQGRFKPGTHEMSGRSDVDLYNTILRASGVSTPFGDMAKFTGLLPITTRVL